MLDKRTHKVLIQLTKLCSKNSYEVVDLNEVLERIPRKFVSDVEGLQQDLKYLQDKGYIDIKHMDESECCLTLLADARLYTENIADVKARTTKMFAWLITSSIISFIFAFLGSFLAHYFLS